MSWKTPLARKTAERMANRPGVVRHLLRQQPLLKALAQDGPALHAVLAQSPPLRPLLQNTAAPGKNDIPSPDWFKPEKFLSAALSDSLLEEIQQRLERRELIAAQVVERLEETSVLESLCTESVLRWLKPALMLDYVTPQMLLEKIGSEKFLELFQDEVLVRHLGAEKMLGHIDPADMLQYLGPNRVVSLLGADTLLSQLTPQVLLEHLSSRDMLEHLGLDTVLNHFSTDRLLGHIGIEKALEYFGAQALITQIGQAAVLDSMAPVVLAKHLGPDRMMEFLGPEAMLQHLGQDRMLEHIGPKAAAQWLGQDRMLELLGPEALAKHLGPDRMMEFLGPDAMTRYLGVSRMLSFIPPEAMVQHLGVERMLQHIGPEKVLTHLGSSRVLEFLAPKTLMQHLGQDRMLASIPPEKMIQHLGQERMLKALDPARVVSALPVAAIAKHVNVVNLVEEIGGNHHAVQAAVIETEGALKKLLTDERALRMLLQDYDVRQKLLALQQFERIGKLDYPYPAVVCSFPRSGSNFLQHIVMQSSGLNNQSIYGRKNLFKPSECTLTVKSHAPSPSYLFEEYSRKVEWPERPDRVVLLQRDPRDVMISFFDYTEFNREVKLNQETFLEEVDYFYASTIDPDAERKQYTAPLTVMDAFKEHVRHWFQHPPEDLKILKVRYEDLVLEPAAAFQRVLDFLELDCDIAFGFLNVKVSLYGNARARRGRAGGWRQAYDEYGVLLDKVHELLRDEIELLGYEMPAEQPAQSEQVAVTVPEAPPEADTQEQNTEPATSREGGTFVETEPSGQPEQHPQAEPQSHFDAQTQESKDAVEAESVAAPQDVELPGDNIAPAQSSPPDVPAPPGDQDTNATLLAKPKRKKKKNR